MARIALIDPTGRAATTVEAVLGNAHEIVVRPRIHAPGDVELVVADLRYEDLADQSTLRSLTSFGPVLVLVDRKDPIPPAVEESGSLSVLRKPFDSFELRVKVEQLLRTVSSPEQTGAVAPRREDDDNGWLEFPFVPATAGALLRRSAKLSAPLWIMGEPGTGRRRIAMAVCRAASPSQRTVTLFPDERLHEVLEREEKAGPFALLVPEIEDRPLIEQERLASILAGPRGFRLIATSIDDPAERVVEGTFSRGLYRHLIGLAVQISPLREQPIAIPPLAQAMARRIARSLGTTGELSFSAEAMARLQTYMWPGNVLELEAVLTRTLAHLGDIDLGDRTIESDELLFTPEDARRPRTSARAGAMRAEVGRLPVRSETTSRGDVTSDREPTIERPRPQVVEMDSPPEHDEPQRGSDEPDFGNIVVGLAHDLRNPMTAIKTFAGAIASGRFDEGSSRELGERVSEECDRLSSCLEELQRYSEFGAPDRRRLDFLEVVRASVQELEGPRAERVEIGAEGVLEAYADPIQLRFVVDNLIEAALAELPKDGRLNVEASSATQGRATVVFSVPSAAGPVTKLRRIVEPGSTALSWRIVLARTVAARNGCKVDVSVAGEAMRIRCLLRGGEEGRGQQTSRINR